MSYDNIISPYFPKKEKYKVGLIIYDKFTLLDLVGPAEVLGDNADQFETVTIGEKKDNLVGSKHDTLLFNTKVDMKQALELDIDILVLPGADPTGLSILNNTKFIEDYKQLCNKAKVVFTICTGSLILAKTGLIDNKFATTNKMAYPKYTPMFPKVNWKYRARWVHHEKYITSSGITAGTDAALYILGLVKGPTKAKEFADTLEYAFQDNPDNDPYAKLAL